MKLLVFVGAGGSAELGVPAMARMADQFRRHVREWNVAPETVAELMPETADIEDLIEKLDILCSAAPTLTELGMDNSAAIEHAKTIQGEVEWFVQHACERVTPERALLQWCAVLREVRNHEMVLATTNYDRAIELAANRMGLEVRDGFSAFGAGEMASWVGLDRGSTEGEVVLLKLHGSTDWYQLEPSREPVKLRHPMPLFGGARLDVPSAGGVLSAALILPSREKRVSHHPYPRLSQAFLNAVDAADLAIFVGTSLRDPHIRQAVLDGAHRRPTVVVNRTRSEDLPAEAIQIMQSASRFLASTLPHALRAADPMESLKGEARGGWERSADGLLDLLGVLVDSSAAVRERCEVIETLYELGISLDAQLLEDLIKDADLTVARFALGLIPAAVDPVSILRTAQSRSDQDSEYRSELELLEELLVRDR